MKIHKFCFVRRTGPFARDTDAGPLSMLGHGYTFIRIKEMRQRYPMFEKIGTNTFECRTFPPSENWTLAWIKGRSALPGRRTWHSEKIRLNRYNRRRIKQLILAEKWEADFRPVRIDQWKVE